MRDSSSLKVTSNVQCNAFSTCQCFLTACKSDLHRHENDLDYLLMQECNRRSCWHSYGCKSAYLIMFCCVCRSGCFRRSCPESIGNSSIRLNIRLPPFFGMHSEYTSQIRNLIRDYRLKVSKKQHKTNHKGKFCFFIIHWLEFELIDCVESLYLSCI